MMQRTAKENAACVLITFVMPIGTHGTGKTSASVKQGKQKQFVMPVNSKIVYFNNTK